MWWHVMVMRGRPPPIYVYSVIGMSGRFAPATHAGNQATEGRTDPIHQGGTRGARGRATSKTMNIETSENPATWNRWV